jgi:predicted RNA methylase
MWRGQHRDQGIVTAADFFTTRNLWTLAAVWDYVQGQPEGIRDALSFVFTAVVHRASRRYQWNPKRPTNVLTSTMYLASLSYEFNVFSLLRRKLNAAVDLYGKTAALPGVAEVHCAPAQRLAHVPDSSIDYVFTDPPFGSNIFYSDSSFLWEAWLGAQTDTAAEAVVNKSVAADHGGKDVAQYEKLMTGAFEEVARVLRPNGWASVMFHNSDDEVWSALQRSVEAAGFEVGAAVAFDKSQPSFKAIKGRLAGERVPAFDVVLHLRRRAANGERARPAVNEDQIGAHIRERLGEHLASAAPSRRTTPYLHSLVMRLLLEDGLPLTGWTYRAVEDLCAVTFEWDGAGWRPRVESGRG